MRFLAEIGDVLSDTVATSKVILPGPLPVGASVPQAATAVPQQTPQEVPTQEFPASQA